MKERSSHSNTSILAGLKWMYVSSVIQALSKLAVLACLARLLDPRDFGLLGIALIFTSCAERVGQVGVGPALVQQTDTSSDDVGTAVTLSLLSGAVTASILALVAPFVGDFFGAPRVRLVIELLSIGFVIDAFAVVPDALLQRQLRFREIMISENVSYIAGNAGIAIFMAYLGFGVWSLVAGSLGMKAVRTGMLMYASPVPLFNRFDVPSAKRLLGMGVGFSLGRVLNFVAIQGDNFVVGRLLGIDMLGMYTRAYQLMTLPATYLGQVLERVLFPAMSNHQHDQTRLRAIFGTNLDLVVFVSLPISVAMFFLSEEIVHVLFGSKWSEIVPVLRVLSLGVFFRTAYKCGDTLARSCGAVYRHAARQAIYSVMVVSGAAAGAALYGLEGVALAVVAAVAINYLLMMALSARLLAISWSAILRAHLPGAWSAMWVSTAMLLFLPSIRGLSDYSAVVLGAAAFACSLAVSLSVLTAAGPMRSETVTRALAMLRNRSAVRMGSTSDASAAVSDA